MAKPATAISLLHIPDADGEVRAGGDEQRAIGAKLYPRNQVVMRLDQAATPALLDIPQDDCLVQAAGGYQLCIGAKRCLSHGIRVSAQDVA